MGQYEGLSAGPFLLRSPYAQGQEVGTRRCQRTADDGAELVLDIAWRDLQEFSQILCGKGTSRGGQQTQQWTTEGAIVAKDAQLRHGHVTDDLRRRRGGKLPGDGRVPQGMVRRQVHRHPGVSAPGDDDTHVGRGSLRQQSGDACTDHIHVSILVKPVNDQHEPPLMLLTFLGRCLVQRLKVRLLHGH
ncbi:hypothetical protein OG234_22030 [Streptomyces sp. NBC_01420]|uniref:hypothetical protein n=1 Tax=Streptomyces sp. NBC_01420 TaxID=2903858 RepID=UPI00324691B2